MGTNDYIKAPKECDDCGETHTCKQAIHIGKSSWGWKFLFAWNGGEFYKSLPQMKKWLEDKEIFDEYNRPVTNTEFWDLVESKKTEKNDHGNINDEHGVVVGGIYFMDGWFS